MDDLQEIERLFESESRVDPQVRERARAQLMRVVATERPARATVLGTRRTGRPRVPALALVATIAALALIVPSLLGSGSPQASAAEVLKQLATHVQSAWESPTAGQYIYTETVGQRWVCQGASCSLQDFERQSWVGKDGSGRVRERAGSGGWSDRTFSSGGLSFDDGTGSLGFGDAELRSYVTSFEPNGVVPDDFALFATIGNLLGETQAVPEVRIALIRLASTLPDARSLGEITDATGRQGIGVAYEDGAVSRQIVFDPGTALVLGQMNVAVDPSNVPPPTPSEVALGAVPGTSETYVNSGLVPSTEDRP